jgi:hypothetical protein
MKGQDLALVTGFKSNNEEYLKIKQAAEENVKSVLTNSKLILKLATLSVIESLRINPELYYFVLYNSSVVTTSTTYGSNYLLLTSGRQHQQQSFNDSYTDLILEEAEKLYNELITELTDRITAATAATIRESSSLSTTHNNNRN